MPRHPVVSALIGFLIIPLPGCSSGGAATDDATTAAAPATTTTTAAPTTTAAFGEPFVVTESCRRNADVGGYECRNQSADPRFADSSVVGDDSTFELTNDGGTWTGVWDYSEDGGGVVEGVGQGSGGYEGLQYSYEGIPPRLVVTIEPVSPAD